MHCLTIKGIKIYISKTAQFDFFIHLLNVYSISYRVLDVGEKVSKVLVPKELISYWKKIDIKELYQ